MSLASIIFISDLIISCCYLTHTWQGALWSPTDGADSHRAIYLVIKSSQLYIIQCVKFSSEDNYSDIRANLSGYLTIC